MAIAAQITKAIDGARILWRLHGATDDTRANEGHVREFSPAGDYVRIAGSCYRDDAGEWLRCSDLKLVAVLEEGVELKSRPRRRGREEGDEWKDAD